MKALIDEGVPKRLASALRALGCDVAGFPNEWKGLKNGKLLDRLVEAGFGCIITSDRSIPFQQDIISRSIAVIILPAQLFVTLYPIASHIAELVQSAQPGQVLRASLNPGQSDR